MAALTGQNEKDLDTQIQEAHDNIIRCKKSRTLVIILGLLVMFGSLRLSDIFNIDDVLAAFLYLTVFIVWIPLFFIFFSVRSSQWKQTYASLVTEKIDFLSVLRKYCTVEEFSLDGKISKSLLESMGWYSMGWLGVITKGRNYLKGTIDGFSIETSYVEVYENRKYRGNIPYFLGQICFLQSHKPPIPLLPSSLSLLCSFFLSCVAFLNAVLAERGAESWEFVFPQLRRHRFYRLPSVH